MKNTRQVQTNEEEGFARYLLDWYERHAREMPWRVSPEDHAAGVRPDPYRTWLSEVMLQQTQVATVRDYFLDFTRRWPGVEALAASDLEDVLKAWAGLGYYSRARNLKRCAEEVLEKHQGKFPEDHAALKSLPGIGDYTASAIAAIAFDQPVPVVDGNVERVMTRYLRITKPLPDAKPMIREALERLLDREKPGEFAQAMMDLGAVICTPKRPSCEICPLNSGCKSRHAGDAEIYPVKKPKPEKPHRTGAAFVILDQRDRVFLCKRANTGLLAGMTQVPTTGWTASKDGDIGMGAAPLHANWRLAGTAKHTFTHFHLTLEVWTTSTITIRGLEGWWCERTDLSSEALPTVMRKVLSVAGISVPNRSGAR